MRQYLLGGRPLHFPFLSGVLRYECATCDAPCCKGAALGIGVSRELVTLTTVQPRAPLFAVPHFHASQMLALASPQEQCWFLDRKHRCRLERVLGREAKPSGCRLFPFVKFRSVGEGVVVLPDFLCPIQVADTKSNHGDTSHDELALEIHRAHVPRGGHAELRAPPDLPWQDAIVLERRVVEESEAHLHASSYVPFAELQHELALAALGVDGKRGTMKRTEEHALRFLGVNETASALTVRDLAGITGVLRIEASPIPRREIAGVLVALSVLAGVAENMRGAVRSARTLTSLFHQRLPFLYALSHLGDRPALRPGASVTNAVRDASATRPALLAVLADIEKNGRRGVAHTLEDLLRKHADDFAPPLSADAVAMLHSLGDVLLRIGTFVPL